MSEFELVLTSKQIVAMYNGYRCNTATVPKYVWNNMWSILWETLVKYLFFIIDNEVIKWRYSIHHAHTIMS